jgi:putative transposase
LLQSERNAGLLIDVLRSLVAEHCFKLHDFVIMPDHVHLLIEVDSDMTIEKAMQLIKGRFSYRLSHEFGYKGEVWQRGFTEVQVLGKENYEQHRNYIAMNPVKARLVDSPEKYPYCFEFLGRKKRSGALAPEERKSLGEPMKSDWMDRLFACLFLASLAGNAANFYRSNAWIHGFNALPAVLLMTTVLFRENNLYKDNKITLRRKFGTYLFLLFFIQFGLEYLRQLIAGVSKSENYLHLVVLAMFIIVYIIVYFFKNPKSSTQNPLSSDLSNEAQKNGNS